MNITKYKIDFGTQQISLKHKMKIEEFVKLLLETYLLENIKFNLNFKKLYSFGNCFPSWKIFKREVTITINQDLLDEKLFEVLKGTLAHEFAQFYHFANFSQKDYLKFLYKMANYTYSRKISKSKINIYSNFAKFYEQITDLTAVKFGFKLISTILQV